MIPGSIETLTNVLSGRYPSDFFRAVTDALPVAVYMTDVEGRLTFFNAAAEKLSGRTPSLGTDEWRLAWNIFLADGTPLPHDQSPMAVALRGGEVPGGIECQAERADGSRFWFTPYPAALRDEEGRIIGGINLLADITERKAAELEANAHFRAIVETTPDCVNAVARDGALLLMNSASLSLVGASSPDEVIGRSFYDLVAPEDRDRYRAFNERICGGVKDSMEFDIVGLHQVRRRLETHGAPLRHADGTTHLAVTPRSRFCGMANRR